MDTPHTSERSSDSYGVALAAERARQEQMNPTPLGSGNTEATLSTCSGHYPDPIRAAIVITQLGPSGEAMGGGGTCVGEFGGAGAAGGGTAGLLGDVFAGNADTGADHVPTKQVTLKKMGLPYLGSTTRGWLRLFVVFLAMSGVSSSVSAAWNRKRLDVPAGHGGSAVVSGCRVVEGSDLAWCEGHMPMSGNRTGEALVEYDVLDNGQMTTYVSRVYIKEPTYLRIDVPRGADGSSRLRAIPVGSVLHVTVSYYDADNGRFNASSGRILSRADDIVRITHTRVGSNFMLLVHCTKPGRTQLQVWDADRPGLEDSVEIRVVTAIAPRPTHSFSPGNLRFDSVKTSQGDPKARGTLEGIPGFEGPSHRVEEENPAERETSADPEAEEVDSNWASSQPHFPAPAKQVPGTMGLAKYYPVIAVILLIALLTAFLFNL